VGVGHVGAPRVFLSYRRDDTPGYAGRVYDSLVERFSEENVFMDIDTIRPGAEFAKVIASALDDCNVFLALIGPTWLESSDVAGRRRLDDPSDFVRLEIEAALRRTILVIPVMVREAEMPPRDRLPDRLAPLTGRQAFELSDQRWRRDMAELLDEIDRASRAARSIAAPIIRESRFLNRRTGWAAVALGVTATAVAMAVTFAPSGAVAGSGTPPASATPTASAATTTPQVTPARVSSTLSPEDRARIQEERHSAAMSAINGIK
jgi:hypothetical protein